MSTVQAVASGRRCRRGGNNGQLPKLFTPVLRKRLVIHRHLSLRAKRKLKPKYYLQFETYAVLILLRGVLKRLSRVVRESDLLLLSLFQHLKGTSSSSSRKIHDRPPYHQSASPAPPPRALSERCSLRRSLSPCSGCKPCKLALCSASAAALERRRARPPRESSRSPRTRNSRATAVRRF